MRTTVLVRAGFSAALTMGAKPLIGHSPLPVLSNLGPELHHHLQSQRAYRPSDYPMYPAEVIEQSARDRLIHYCHIVETGNESCRIQHSSMAAKGRIKARKQKHKTGDAVLGGGGPGGKQGKIK